MSGQTGAEHGDPLVARAQAFTAATTPQEIEALLNEVADEVVSGKRSPADGTAVWRAAAAARKARKGDFEKQYREIERLKKAEKRKRQSNGHDQDDDDENEAGAAFFRRLLAIVGEMQRFEAFQVRFDELFEGAFKGVMEGILTPEHMATLFELVKERTGYTINTLKARARIVLRAKFPKVAGLVDLRAEIYIGSGRHHEVAIESETEILAEAENLFADATRLVRVSDRTAAYAADDPDEKFPIHPPVLQGIGTELMMQEMSKTARFWQLTAKGEVAYKSPPEKIANLILQRSAEWTFKRITGLTSSPTILGDGRIVEARGYDAASGLYINNPPSLEPVPAIPAYEQALEAYRFLDEGIFGGFRFAEPADLNRGVAMAGTLSAVGRAGLGAAPLLEITAPEPGSGKSFLMDCISMLIQNTRCPVVGATDDPKEFEKRLDSAFMARRQIVSLDNLSGELRSNKLAQALTQAAVDIRFFGTQSEVEVRPSSFVAVNGNNFRVSGDLIRRTIRLRLDAGVSEPWRTVRYDETKDPLEFIAANRGRCLRAALIVLRFAIVTNRAPKAALSPIASFERWSQTVRKAVMLLSGVDVVHSNVGLKDNENEGIVELFEAWAEFIGVGEPLRAKEIIAATREPEAEVFDARGARMRGLSDDEIEAERAGFEEGKKQQRRKRERFRDALHDFLRGALDAGVMGLRLREFRDRRIGGYFVTEGGVAGKTVQWVLLREGQGARGRLF